MAVIAPIVGAAIGGSIATAINAAWVAGTIGHAVGSAIGATLLSHLFRPKMPGVEGPRMQDVSVQVSTYGAPIPIVWGTCMLAGNVIWSAGIREVATTSRVRSGKGGRRGGGQTVTTYSYYGTWAVGLCEGEITCIRRIWLDTDLVFDAGNPAAEAANQAFLAKVKIYRGTEDQLPDPTIQAHVGAANAPAYRGLAYIVLNDILLERYGNRLPSVRVEVVRTDLYYTTETYDLWNTEAAAAGLALTGAVLLETPIDGARFGVSITGSEIRENALGIEFSRMGLTLIGGLIQVPNQPVGDQENARVSANLVTGELQTIYGHKNYNADPEPAKVELALLSGLLYTTVVQYNTDDAAKTHLAILDGELT